MNASIPVRVNSMRKQLEKLDQLGANVEETRLLDDLRSDLDPPVAELNRALSQCALLLECGISLEGPSSLDPARKRAGDLIEKFQTNKKASTLKKGVGWTNLIREIKTASKDLASAAAIRWKDYRQEIFTGEAPGVVRGRIALTPENRAALSQYERLYQLFQVEFNRLPADRVTIERVQSLANELTKTAKDFDYDVPTDVKRFLEAVQNGGAPLDLLTDAVNTWLDENGAFANYRILPRGADGR